MLVNVALFCTVADLAKARAVLGDIMGSDESAGLVRTLSKDGTGKPTHHGGWPSLSKEQADKFKDQDVLDWDAERDFWDAAAERNLKLIEDPEDVP